MNIECTCNEPSHSADFGMIHLTRCVHCAFLPILSVFCQSPVLKPPISTRYLNLGSHVYLIVSELVSYIHLRCITLKPSSFQVHVYSEDGALRPINAVIETPQNPKSVAVYNSVKSPFLFPPPRPPSDHPNPNPNSCGGRQLAQETPVVQLAQETSHFFNPNPVLI